MLLPIVVSRRRAPTVRPGTRGRFGPRVCTARVTDDDITSLEYPATLTGSEPIVVSWHGWWSNGVVREGERTLGTLPDEEAFRAGATLPSNRPCRPRRARGTCSGSPAR